MKLRWHPSRELIAAYASGAIPLGPSLALRVHFDACATCRRSSERLEEAEGRLLLSMPGAPLELEALRRALTRLDAPMQSAEGPEQPAPLISPLPSELAEIGLLPAIHLSDDTWVAHLDAPRADGWRTYLFSCPRDGALPVHGHCGDELIVVLEGAYRDHREFRAGDFVENKVGFVHDMKASGDGRLVALIASRGAIDWRCEDLEVGRRLDI